jgi:hypothetical protein
VTRDNDDDDEGDDDDDDDNDNNDNNDNNIRNNELIVAFSAYGRQESCIQGFGGVS